MRYYILGISPSLTFPFLLCRRTTPQDGLEAGHQLYVGSFFGILPDPGTDGYEALAFDSFDKAQDHVEAEKRAGSEWNYAIHAATP